MAPPSQLAIATSSVQRLVKEEASYHRELQQQTERIRRLETDNDETDENKEYVLRQERQALQETRNMLPTLKKKIQDAVAKLEAQLIQEGKKGAESNVEEIDAAKEVISKAKTAEREVS